MISSKYTWILEGVGKRKLSFTHTCCHPPHAHTDSHNTRSSTHSTYLDVIKVEQPAVAVEEVIGAIAVEDALSEMIGPPVIARVRRLPGSTTYLQDFLHREHWRQPWSCPEQMMAHYKESNDEARRAALPALNRRLAHIQTIPSHAVRAEPRRKIRWPLERAHFAISRSGALRWMRPLLRLLLLLLLLLPTLLLLLLLLLLRCQLKLLL